MSKINPRQMFLLDEACKPIHDAFNGCPYLVGSALKDDNNIFNDVDVRLILFDKKYDKINESIGQKGIAFVGFMIGEYLTSKTGLPVDFQIQRNSEANEKHKGRRNPLGTRNLGDYKGDAPPLSGKTPDNN